MTKGYNMIHTTNNGDEEKQMMMKDEMTHFIDEEQQQQLHHQKLYQHNPQDVEGEIEILQQQQQVVSKYNSSSSNNDNNTKNKNRSDDTNMTAVHDDEEEEDENYEEEEEEEENDRQRLLDENYNHTKNTSSKDRSSHSNYNSHSRSKTNNRMIVTLLSSIMISCMVMSFTIVIIMNYSHIMQQHMNNNNTNTIHNSNNDSVNTNGKGKNPCQQQDENNNNNNNNMDDTDEMMMKLLNQRFFQSSKQLMIQPIYPESSISSNMNETDRSSSSNVNVVAEVAISNIQQLILVSQQFVHLHHMKTGGTSIDTLINCAINRLRQLQFQIIPVVDNNNNNNNMDDETSTGSTVTSSPSFRLTVPHTTIHECSESYYASCTGRVRDTNGVSIIPEPSSQIAKQVQQRQMSCIKSVSNAAILSYCAPLKDLYTPFLWMNLITTNNNSTTTGISDNIINNNDNTISTSTSSSIPSDGTIIGTNEHDTSTIGSKQPTLPIHAITVLRHPIARVWSMYRFQTKACYSCRPLLDIYKQIDNEHLYNISTYDPITNMTLPSIRNMCQSQLINHQTRNMLSSINVNDEISFAFNYTNEQIINAIYNMKHTFTMIGLTEDMINTAKMVGIVFPWLKEDLLFNELTSATTNSNNTESDIAWDTIFGLHQSDLYDYDKNNDDMMKLHVIPPNDLSSLMKCPIQHANASPKNNRCGMNNQHLDLPNAPPDNATINAIIQHNLADIELYNAAVRQFQLQKQVLGII